MHCATGKELPTIASAVSSESEEAIGRFGEERLGPAMAKVGITAEPEVTFHAAHEVFLPAETTLTAT